MNYKFAFLLSAALAFPATAQITFDDSPPPAASKPSAKKSGLDKTECRVQDSSGTRLGAKKICMTVREWQDWEQLNRDEVIKLQQNTHQTPSG